MIIHGQPGAEKQRETLCPRIESANAFKVIAEEYCAKRRCEGGEGWAPAPATDVDVMTAPPSVSKGLLKHILSEKGIEGFLADWDKTGQSIECVLLRVAKIVSRELRIATRRLGRRGAQWRNGGWIIWMNLKPDNIVAAGGRLTLVVGVAHEISASEALEHTSFWGRASEGADGARLLTLATAASVRSACPCD